MVWYCLNLDVRFSSWVIRFLLEFFPLVGLFVCVYVYIMFAYNYGVIWLDLAFVNQVFVLDILGSGVDFRFKVKTRIFAIVFWAWVWNFGFIGYALCFIHCNSFHLVLFQFWHCLDLDIFLFLIFLCVCMYVCTSANVCSYGVTWLFLISVVTDFGWMFISICSVNG